MNKDIKEKFGFTLAEGATHVGIFHNTRRVGFTLAEVLITLGIIGIVSAMTIPTLVKKYQEKIIINQVWNSYAMLNEAFKRAINDHGHVNEWCNIQTVNDYPICAEKIRDLLSQYLKISKNCTSWLYMGKCMNGNLKHTSTQGEKDLIHFQSGYFKSMILQNGMGLTIDARNWGNSSSSWCKIATNLQKEQQINALSSNNCGFLYLDLNGNKGPNKDGVDLFAFSIRNNGLVAHGQDGLHTHISFERNCLKKPMTSPDQGRGSCTSWILQNRNLDYLHCPEKLGWNKARSCDE